MTPSPLIQEATRRLVENFHPAKVILFGSRARGTASEESDADLLVITRTTPGRERRQLWLAMERSMRGLGIATDIVVMTPEEYEASRNDSTSFAYPASREGRVLYERAA